MPAETAHHFTFSLVRLLYNIPGIRAVVRWLFGYTNPQLERELFGIKFPNPIGIAAGFDKDARLIGPLADIGFGFVEIGTVTPKPQAGNPQPRLFRLPSDGGLINRMGFNNQGLAAAVDRLKKSSSKVVIGGNIGKNKNTPNDQASEDYLTCFEALYPLVDYFVVNVSSPNTPWFKGTSGERALNGVTIPLTNSKQSTSPPKTVAFKDCSRSL